MEKDLQTSAKTFEVISTRDGTLNGVHYAKGDKLQVTQKQFGKMFRRGAIKKTDEAKAAAAGLEPATDDNVAPTVEGNDPVDATNAIDGHMATDVDAEVAEAAAVAAPARRTTRTTTK